MVVRMGLKYEQTIMMELKDMRQNERLEGRTYAIYKGPTGKFGPIDFGPGKYVADHAYVYCPDTGKYFDCWGGHEGPEPRHLRCAGQGNYAVANCYRGPGVDWFKYIPSISGSSVSGNTHDNACLGPYGVLGLCHQAANCFLLSAGVTLNNNVRGYWASVLSYGVYGRFHDIWLEYVYKRCLERKEKVGLTEEGEDPLFVKIRQLHESFSAQSTKPHHHEVIIKEAAVVTNHHAPEVDTSQYRELHAQFLKDKDAAIASDLKGKDLAIKINELSTQFQNKVAEIIGHEAYEKLTGVKYGETIDIVNPEWME